jgi:type IX secretion system PorP/SprF family membrane protein
MRKFLLIMLLFFPAFIFAQDIHFTQYTNTPLYLNPANAGMFQGINRFGASHRMQWRSVSTPYVTFSAFSDMRVHAFKYARPVLGVGVIFNRDQAGDSEFGTTQAGLNTSLIIPVGSASSKILSLGAGLFFNQRSLTYDKLTFDNQYNGYTYDPSLPNNETFIKDKLTFLDFSFGASVKIYQGGRKFNHFGLAVSHLNKPFQSLFDNKNIKLDRKLVLYEITRFTLGKNTEIDPSILLGFQGTYHEFVPGATFRMIRNSSIENFFALTASIFWRVGDAMIPSIGADYKLWTAALSYDVNLSGLKPASNLKGGYEITLLYKMDKTKARREKSIPCPIM